MKKKFAVQLYSVRSEFAKDLWGTLRKVKAMGYDGVEFFGEFTHTAQELKAALEDTGLVCVGWHTPWEYVQPQNLMATVTYNRVIGNTEIVVPGLPKELTCSKDAWLKTAEAFNKLAEKLTPYGMKIAYHNHGNEFKPMEDGDIPWHYFYDNTVADVGMQLDNGNAWSAGPDTDIYDPLKRYPQRARTLHLKPYSVKNGYKTILGDDDIDWEKFFKLAQKHQNVDWHIVEYECEALYTQLEGIEKCIKALRKLEAEGKIA